MNRGSREADETASAPSAAHREGAECPSTHDELLRTEQLLEAHLQNSPLAIIEFDCDFRVMRWSDEAQRVFGYAADEILGRAIGDMKWVYEEDIQLVEAETARLFNGDAPRSKNVNRNYRKDGAVIWCEWYSSAIYDEGGVLTSVLSLVLDVTDRKRAQEAEQRELETTQVLLEIASALAVHHSLSDVLNELCGSVLRAIGHARVTVSLWEDESSEFSVAASCGADAVPVGRVVNLSELSPPARRAVEEKAPALVDYDALAEGERGVESTWTSHLAFHVPLLYRGRLVGFLGADDGAKRREFTVGDMKILRGIGPQAAAAIESSQLYERELRARRVNEALSRIERSIHSTLDRSEVLSRVAAESAGAIGAEGTVLLVREGDMWSVAYAYNTPVDPIVASFTDTEAPLIARAIERGAPIAVGDAYHDPRTNEALQRRLGVQAVMVVPVFVGGEPVAAVFFDYSRPRRFTDEERTYAARLGSSLGLAIANAELYEGERRIAETLQETLVVVPSHMPGASFSRAYETASHELGRVGGDFVDIFEVRKHVLGVAVGDVSGKGIDAAVVTSLVRNTIRVHAVDGLPPSEVCRKTNMVVRRFTQIEAFVTVFFGLLNTRNGLLTYVNAGHPAGLVFGNGEDIEELAFRSPILGAFDDIACAEYRAVLHSGQRLLLYTDGVTEARSADGRFLGFEGLQAAIRRHGDTSTSELAQRLMGEVKEFSGRRLRDDAALLIVEPTEVKMDSPAHPQLDLE